MDNSIQAIFIGDSITKAWNEISPTFFNKSNFISKGVNGETTVEILKRFTTDVIDQKPKLVVILAGINDLAGNSGPITNLMIQANFAIMAELASKHSIEVMFCSILPANSIPWRIQINPSFRIKEINRWLTSYCELNNYVFVDFYSSMVDENDGLDITFTKDGVHTNKEGYKLMENIITPFLIQKLR